MSMAYLDETELLLSVDTRSRLVSPLLQHIVYFIF